MFAERRVLPDIYGGNRTFFLKVLQLPRFPIENIEILSNLTDKTISSFLMPVRAPAGALLCPMQQSKQNAFLHYVNLSVWSPVVDTVFIVPLWQFTRSLSLFQSGVPKLGQKNTCPQTDGPLILLTERAPLILRRALLLTATEVAIIPI